MSLFCFVATGEMMFFFFMIDSVERFLLASHLTLGTFLGLLSILGKLLSRVFHRRAGGFQGISEVGCRSKSQILSELIPLVDWLVFGVPNVVAYYEGHVRPCAFIYQGELCRESGC